MIWLVVFGLGFWCLHQQQRLGQLTERLVQLSRELALLTDRESKRSAVETVKPALIAKAVEPVDVPETAALATAVEEALPEPEAALTVEPEPEAALPWGALPVEAEPAIVHAPIVRAAPAEPPRPIAPPPPGPSLSEWLAENGLAWIGGGALALGGLLLVAYAAQRGFFTPALRIFAATILGLAALGVGEALRRGVWARSGPNQLVAALTTAAGAATLYAAIWAADLLYQFVPPGEAGALLAAVSLGLLALALLHGEALGLLAIAAAYAVPAVTGGGWGNGAWGGGALDGFVALILATGLAIAGLGAWTRAGAFALAGAGLWALERFGWSDRNGASLIAGAAPLLALAATLYARGSAPREPEAPRPFDNLAAAAVLGASLLAMLLLVSLKVAPPQAPVAAVLAIILATALGVRAGLISPNLLWAPALALDCAALTSSATTWLQVLAPPGVVPWLLPALATLALAGFEGARRSRNPRAAAVAGAAGTALTLTLAAPALARDLPRLDMAVDVAFALLFAAGAAILARRSADARTDWTPAAFIAAAAEVTGLALHASLDARMAPTAYGLLAVVLAALAVRVAWRGFAESAAVAALASLGSLLARPVAGDALIGLVGPGAVIACCAPAALAQFAAWGVLRRRADVRGSIEAISTTALVSALLGAFLSLQTLAQTRTDGMGLDSFTEASLRTLLLLAAGLVLAIRGAATALGRARAPILLGLGALHGLVLQAILLHPWWGVGGHPVLGPPLADGLLLGLLAPGLLLLDAARRPGVREARLSAAAVGAALAFAAVWLISEIRRLFHGPPLDQGALGFSEIAAYAAAALGLALALDAGRTRLNALTDSGRVIGDLVDGVAWIASALALWFLAYVASPWWGPLDGDLQAAVLLIALYIAGCGLNAALAWRARTHGRAMLARAALVAAGIEVFALISILVRYAFHGAAMRAPLREASLETWTFSAVWALYGLLLLVIGAGRRDPALRALGLVALLGTTAKVFLFDLARLDGPIRAASFLALGVVLLMGALAARRFAPRTPAPETSEAGGT